jgi:hypothetical protein
MIDNFSHKQSAVLEFKANVIDRNGINLQTDTGWMLASWPLNEQQAILTND